MLPAPRITIGILCYNAAATIARAIASATAQDWPDIEIVVVDDNSSDDSLRIIQDYAARDPRIKVIANAANKGASANRQAVLDAASGAFVAFFDDDDESQPNRLRVQYNHIIETENKTGNKLVACYASGIRIYPNGYTKPLPAIGSHGAAPQGTAMADRLLFFGGDNLAFYGFGTPTCALMARIETFITAGGFDPAFRRVEDIDFAVRLALKGGIFTGSAEPVFIQHATQGSDKSHDRNLEAEIQLADKHRAYLETRRRYRYAQVWPKIRHAHFRRNYPKMLGLLLGLWLRHPVAVTRHILTTGPARLRHERKIGGV